MLIFTRNQTRWASKPLDKAEVERLQKPQIETGIGPNIAHASYLVNLGTPDEALAAKSVEALVDEMRRGEQLGLMGVVFHPGAHMGEGVEAGIARVSRCIDRIFEELGPGGKTALLIENTAGQGTALGHDFAHLRDIIAGSRHADRLGICMDTCHAFAAGHALSTPEAYEATISELVAAATVEKIRAFHLNDSLRDFASRKDRHAQLNEGTIGIAPFTFLVKDPRFVDRPGILETPAGEERYPQELALLKEFRKG